MTNSELLGAAAETHGLIQSNRSETRDNSKPVLNALPQQGPPDYHPTEPMHNFIAPRLPPSTTQSEPLDFTLPHENDKNLFIDKHLKPTREFNPLQFQTDSAHIDPADHHRTSGDDRHQVTSGGGMSGVFTAHGGGFGEGVLSHKGGLGWGDNQSAEMAGALLSKKVQHDSPINMAVEGVVKATKKGGAMSFAIPFTRIGNDAATLGLNEIGRSSRMKKGGGIGIKRHELAGGGLKEGEGGAWEMKGGKSKFWRNMAVNLTGLANNVSRAFADNGAEGGEIEKKKQLM